MTRIGRIAIPVAIALIIGATIIFLFSTGDGLSNGTYTKVSDGSGFSVYNFESFIIEGNIFRGSYGLAASVGMDMNFDFTYKISDGKLMLTAQGVTQSFSFERQGSSYYFDGVEYRRT
jgi:hypothetical protein